jgi:hypothetical protein
MACCSISNRATVGRRSDLSRRRAPGTWTAPWDATERIVRERSAAARHGARLRRTAVATDPLIAPQLPGYFIDRHAFRRQRLIRGRARGLTFSAPPAAGRSAYLAALVRPARRLNGWVPSPDGSTGTGDFYESLRRRWKEFGTRAGLPSGAARLPDARLLTWRQVMDESVFYPAAPVFRGATFIDALAETSATAILNEVGPGGVIDFFCFMLQVHETMHHHQTGEPLLNEVVQAWIWSRFLTEESLWEFQRGTTHSLVREAQVVERYPELVDAAATARLDTAKMIQSISADNAYFTCCLLGYLFDTGDLRYGDYLARIEDALANRANSKAMRDIAMSLLCNAPFSPSL